MEKVPSWMMIYCLLWLLPLAAALTDVHGRIFPKEKYVLKGSNRSIYCQYTDGPIKDVYWNWSTVLSPEPIDGIFNGTVRQLTIPYLSADEVQVKCLFNKSPPQNVDEITITSGYPPETPKNISCFYFHKDNVTCSWTPKRDPQIPTTFNLTMNNDTGKKCLTTSTKYCYYFPNSSDQFGREHIVRLQAENALGNATGEFTVNTAKIVKLDAPEILSLKAFPAQDPLFSISWRRPTLAPDELDVRCSLRYKQKQDDQWDYTPDLYMEKQKNMSYDLSGLTVFTKYTVSLRCIGSSGQLWWSEWSGERTGWTAEQAPTHSVELWRAIRTTSHTRLVYLRWKERSSIRPLGITLGYNVQWFPEGRTIDSRNETTTNNEMILNLSKDAYIISVMYYNSAGWSPKAILRIPAVGEKTRQVISRLQISAAEGGDTNVTWTVTDSRCRRFVLDWCVDLGENLCNISFHYVENTTKWAIEKGILKPYKRYKISVYPILEDRVESPSTTNFYVKEGAPRSGPNPEVKKLGKTEVTIGWHPLRPEETNGFITAFSIIYRPVDGYESAVTVNSDVYEYTLRSLMPDTHYSSRVVASTSAGNTSGDPTDFHTLAESTEYIGALIGILGTCLLLLLVLGIAYKYKKDKVKNLLCPDVPDPAHSSISEWAPDQLQAVRFLNPLQIDGTLHSRDLRILHAVYVNDKADREFLLAALWESTEAAAPMDESSIAMHYAVTENCPDGADCVPLLHGAPSPQASKRNNSHSLLHGNRTPTADELPQDLSYSEDTATVNPYLKNSVRTREALHVTESPKT
ncbi:interleukin-31 receptor subunit alpha [Eleutherodactylus coqui]|uniref:interleukin-31 receptor subunit alpha n=1 Tax=Eleutherodactylus coqui TaxID=57060 RepID=UPI0034619B35